MKLNLEKFVRLQRRCAVIQSSLRTASENYREARSEKGRLESLGREYERAGSLRTVTREASADDGATVLVQEREVVGYPEYRKDLERARNEVAAAQEHHDVIQRESEPFTRLVAHLETFLQKEGVDLRDLPRHVAPPPRPSATPPPLSDVAALRDRIVELREALDGLDRAPCSQADTFEKIDAWLTDAVESLAVNAASLFVSTDPKLPFTLFERDSGQIHDMVDRRTTEGLLAAVAETKLRAILRAAASREAKKRGGWGPSSDERAKRLAELEAELLSLEIEEERALEHMELVGVGIARRAEADPRAVLALVSE